MLQDAFGKLLLIFFSVSLSLLSYSSLTYADCRDRDCITVTFNINCIYHRDGHDGFEKCKTASRFNKAVWDDGDELLDRSVEPFNPPFEVQCDDKVIYNAAAHRYTDRHGTRLQALSGPFPATVLPRDALVDDHKYFPSVLELGEQTLKGSCYIYTGPP